MRTLSFLSHLPKQNKIVYTNRGVGHGGMGEMHPLTFLEGETCPKSPPHTHTHFFKNDKKAVNNNTTQTKN